MEWTTDPCLVLCARASPTWQVTHLGCISQDKSTMSQQCALVSSKKAIGVLGALRTVWPADQGRSSSSSSSGLPWWAAPRVLHPVLGSKMMKRVPWRAGGIIRGLVSLMGRSWACPAWKRVWEGNLIRAHKYLKGRCQENGARFSPAVPSDRTRHSRHRLKHRKLHLNMRKSFLTLRVTEHCQAARRICGVSFSGDIKNMPG